MKFDNDFREIKIRHILLMFLIILIVAILGIVALSIKGEISNTDTNKLCLFAEFLIAIMIFFKLGPSKKNINILYKDFKNNLNMKEIVRIVLFITCLRIGSSNIITDIAYIISPSFASWLKNNSSLVINSMTDYWIVFVIVVFLAPFTEEIIFRNVLFKRLSKKFNIYVGLIMSSIIFCSYNINSEMIELFLLGIVNCMLYVKYENILMPMFIYFIDSLIKMIIFILFGKFGDQAIVLTSNDMILYAVSGLILLTIGIICFLKFINENKIYLREMHNKNKAINSI